MVELIRKSKTEAELRIQGEVVPSDFQIPQGLQRLTVTIDSSGGDALEGLRLYSLIKNSDAKEKAAEVTVAMSAASLAAVACDEIRMSSGALLMIHGISDFTKINRKNAGEILSEIDSLDDTYAQCYAQNSKTPKETFFEMMLRDTFLNADELRGLGFPVVKTDTGKVHLPNLNIETGQRKTAEAPEKALTLELMKRYGF